jgi:hypothetical protein
MEFKNFIKNEMGLNFEEFKSVSFSEVKKGGNMQKRLSRFLHKSDKSKGAIERRMYDVFRFGQALFRLGLEDEILKYINNMAPEKKQRTLLVTERSQKKELDDLLSKGRSFLKDQPEKTVLRGHKWKLQFKVTEADGCNVDLPSSIVSQLSTVDLKKLCPEIGERFVESLDVYAGEVYRLTTNDSHERPFLCNYSMLSAVSMGQENGESTVRMRALSIGDLHYHNDVEIKMDSAEFEIPVDKLTETAVKNQLLQELKGRKCVVKVSQFPLRNPGAITTSVAGGLTLPGGVVFSNTLTIQPGAGYVALSRVRSADLFSMLHLPRGDDCCEANAHDFKGHRACVVLENFLAERLGGSGHGVTEGNFYVENMSIEILGKNNYPVDILNYGIRILHVSSL